MNYNNRRYRVVNGKMEKRWNGDEAGWFKTKVEAIEATLAAAPDPAIEPDSDVVVLDEKPRETLTLKRRPGRPRKIHA